MSENSRPSAHTQRYDRQLRLWAASGQTSLESSKVLIIGSSSLSAQVLKNLVLPGIGNFVVLDERKVTQEDIGNNFFLEESSLGKSRAIEMARLVGELNDSVKGKGREESPSSLLSSNSSLLRESSLVICVNQSPSFTSQLAEICWNGGSQETSEIEKKKNSRPLMIVEGSGMVGRVRVCVREAGIISTHPPSLNALRLLTPFPTLISYFQSYNLDFPDPSTGKPNTQQITHVPFPIILLRVLSVWCQTHSHHPALAPGLTGKEKTAQKNEFKELLETMRGEVIKEAREKGGEEASDLDLENWDEAKENLGRWVFGDRAEDKVTEELQAWFKDPECEVTKESSNFWLLLSALRSFTSSSPTSSPPGSEGLLPLSGALPDFKSLSSTYISLSQIYRQKHVEDLQNFTSHLQNLLSSLILPPDTINSEEILTFVKNAGYLKLIRGRSLNDSKETPKADKVKEAFWSVLDPPGPVIQQHLAFEVAEEFWKVESRWPGASKGFTNLCLGVNGDEKDEEVDLTADETKMKELAKELLKKYEISEDDEIMMEKIDDALSEMVRSAHSDLSSTSALLGGIAAQESIKIITKQYIPLDNTAVYDGIRGSVGSFGL